MVMSAADVLFKNMLKARRGFSTVTDRNAARVTSRAFLSPFGRNIFACA